MSAPRPAHWKAHVGDKQRYACVQHYEALKLAAFGLVTDIACGAHFPQPVPPHERDSAGVWCGFCNKETA